MAQPSRMDAVPVEPEERRTRDRYTCDLKSSCKPVETRPGTGWPAKVRDVSATGVRLTMFRRFEPGTLLAVELQDTTGVSRMFLARVVRVARQVRGRWAHGCALDGELDDQDLEALVETPYTAWIQEQPAKQEQPPAAQSGAGPLDGQPNADNLSEVSVVQDPHSRESEPCEQTLQESPTAKEQETEPVVSGTALAGQPQTN